MRQNLLRWMLLNRYLLKYCVESFFYLALCKLMITLVPHKFWGLKSCYFQCETLKENMTRFGKEILAVQRAVRLLARYVPWHSQCLDQALAVQHMLTRRGLHTTLYLGMRKDNNKNWLAHAWVRCGDHWVIGYQPEWVYTVVGAYAKIF